MANHSQSPAMDLRERLLRPQTDLGFQLLKDNPGAWIDHHNADIASISQAYTENMVPFVAHANLRHILFQRSFLFVSAASQRLDASQTELRNLIEAANPAREDTIARLSDYRKVKSTLQRLAQPPPRPPSYVALRREEANSSNSGAGRLDQMLDEVMKLDVMHLAALVLQCLSDPPTRARLLTKKTETEVDQNLLDLFQGLLDYPALQPVHPPILIALSHLAKEASMFPRSLVHEPQSVEIVSRFPDSSGSYGYVYKGRLKRDSTDVAVKVLRREVWPDEARIIRLFSREAILWNQLRHPNILPFYGVYRWPANEPQVALLSPWMHNGNLGEYLRLNPNIDKKPLVLDIAKGLNYLHTLPSPFIHGDLKCNNILIASTGRACLADFGLCRLDARTDQSSSTNTMGGQFLYTAPELLLDHNPHDMVRPGSRVGGQLRKTTQTDVYAFACLVYEMYQGLPRFSDLRNYKDQLDAILTSQPCRRPSHLLDERLWELMNRMWDVEPHKRPSIAAFLEEYDPPPAPPPAAPQSTPLAPFVAQPSSSRPGMASMVDETTRNRNEISQYSRVPATYPLRSSTFNARPPSAGSEATGSSGRSWNWPTTGQWTGRLLGSRASLGTANTEWSSSTYYDSSSSGSYVNVTGPNSGGGDQELRREDGRWLQERSKTVTLIPKANKETLLQDDILIALMGPTGTGKSSFINTSMGQKVAPVSDSVYSCTDKVKVYGCYHPRDNTRRVFLVDTPGFEHTGMSDVKTLKLIAKWLKRTYNTKVLLSGVLQFFPIDRARLAGSNRSNLEVFTEICGPNALRNVVVVTTGWDEMDEGSKELKEAESREEELLRDFLAQAIEEGCRYERYSKREYDAAWDILDLLQSSGRALQIQHEMKGWSIRNTSAFKALTGFFRR